jgi:hypothetical protein
MSNKASLNSVIGEPSIALLCSIILLFSIVYSYILRVPIYISRILI